SPSYQMPRPGARAMAAAAPGRSGAGRRRTAGAVPTPARTPGPARSTPGPTGRSPAATTSGPLAGGPLAGTRRVLGHAGSVLGQAPGLGRDLRGGQQPRGARRGGAQIDVAEPFEVVGALVRPRQRLGVSERAVVGHQTG